MDYILSLLRLNDVVDEDEAIQFLLFIFGIATVLYLLPAFWLVFYPVIKVIAILTIVIFVINIILPRPLFAFAFSLGAGGLSSGLGLMLTWVFVLVRIVVSLIVMFYPFFLIYAVVRYTWLDFTTGAVAGVHNDASDVPLFISDFFKFTGGGIGLGLLYAYGKKFLTK